MGANGPRKTDKDHGVGWFLAGQPRSVTARTELPDADAGYSVLPLLVTCPLKQTKRFLSYVFLQVQTTGAELQLSTLSTCISGVTTFTRSCDISKIWVIKFGHLDRHESLGEHQFLEEDISDVLLHSSKEQRKALSAMKKMEKEAVYVSTN